MVFEEIAFYFFQFEFDIGKRITCDIAVSDGYANDLPEILRYLTAEL